MPLSLALEETPWLGLRGLIHGTTHTTRDAHVVIRVQFHQLSQ